MTTKSRSKDEIREIVLKLGALVGDLEDGEKFSLDRDAPCREPGVTCLVCTGCWGCHYTWRCPTLSERIANPCKGTRDGEV